MTPQLQWKWELLDLSSVEGRKGAADIIAAVAPTKGIGARFFNIEWKLGSRPDWSSLRIYVLRHGERVVGLAPFLRQFRPLKFHFGEVTIGSVGLTRFSLIGDVYISDLIDPGETTAAVEGLMEALLQNLGKREAVFFEGLPTDGPTHRVLAGRGEVTKRLRTIQLGEAFHHQFISLPYYFKDYVMQMGARSRQSVQYSQRRLYRDMENRVLVRRFDRPEVVENFISDASAVSRKTYQWQLLGLGLRDDQETTDSLRFAAERGWFRSYVLYCRDQPCAFMLGYMYGDCYYYDDVGYDPEYAKWSVGTVLQMEVLKDLLDADSKPSYFDFSTGFGEHKGRFGNLSRPEVNVLVLRRNVRGTWLAGSFSAVTSVASSVIGLLERVGLKARLKRFVRRLKSG